VVRHRTGARGGTAIAAELAARGVARPVVLEAIRGIDPESEVEAASRTAQRWLPRAEPGSLRSLLDIAGPRLARRGYSSAVIREACRRAMGTVADP
jgi:SOS response regulatory protein OraA/RecX